MKNSIVGLSFLVLCLIDGSYACSGATCDECIASDPSCAWCVKEDFTGQRCQVFSSLIDAGCELNNIESPESTTAYRQDERVRDSRGNDKAIQVQPQVVRITTRPRKKETFTMTFRAADNYPVDLYFLFDNSLSMHTHIKSLGMLANDIGRSIGEISSNYRMAYGVFQDKVILPFTDITPTRLENPCINARANNLCSPPFEFKHLLDMTHDTKAFEAVVNNTQLTGNIDKPEGSTDAILQAVTCTQRIGWRAGSRKLLIFASNDRFHVAGDGKLAGIVFPNDGKCHVDGAGHYTKEVLQDYPSIAQLTDIVGKHEVHIIFTVTNDQTQLFKELSRRIPQSTVELLAESGSGNKDIREIIDKKYKEMISEVEILHTPVEGVDVQIKAKSSACERKNTNVCKGITIGQSVEFDVELRVRSCPAAGEPEERIVEIYPGSLSSDKLTLQIKTQCTCDCAQDQSTWELNSPLCSDGNGTLKCGQCDCNAGRFGQTCECDATHTDAIQATCFEPGSNSTDSECNNAGTCVCGVCQCDEGFSGTYCECNDRSCGSFQRELCGGVRGRCRCGECVCEPEYEGLTCECPISNTSCLSVDGKLCSDQGKCECGECSCNEGHVGLYCETCFLCGDSVCDVPEYRDCAECFLEKEGKVGDSGSSTINGDGLDCSLTCPHMELIDQLEDTEENNVCSVKLSDGCFFTFVVSSIDTNVTIRVVKDKQCPTPLNMTPIVIGVVIGVVLLGLLILLLWKLVTWTLDKREYTKFQQDISKGQWAQNDNPFYKGATTTYRNPMLDPDDPTLDAKS